MKHFLGFAALIAGLVIGSFSAEAATCFWVGGTGTWDNSTDAAHWSSGTGGAGSTCAATGGVPKNAGDVATFDGASGGGTVTNNVDISIAQITMGAFTGTLDFATNNKNVTLTTAFSGTGTGARVINMGNGTWSLTATSGTVFDNGVNTNLTFNANASTILLSATATATRSLVLGTRTYNNVTVTNPAQNSFLVDFNNSGAFTVSGNLTLTNVQQVRLPASTTVTVSGTFIYDGTSTKQGSLFTGATAGTLSVAGAATLSWLFVQNITKSGAGSITVNNGFDGGGNTGITINAPSGGGGGKIIGG